MFHPGATDQQDMLLDAVKLSDGRIAATVSSNAWGGDPHLYLFAQQDGRWLIDEIGPMPNDSSVGGVGNVTIPAVSGRKRGRSDTAGCRLRLGVDASTLSVSAIETVDWPDSALGCPEDGGVYAQVISPGYQITVTDGATSLEYTHRPERRLRHPRESVRTRQVVGHGLRVHDLRPASAATRLAPSIDAAINVTGIAP